MTVRMTRDGALIAEDTFTLDYEVTPGPNGPDCDPPECRFAEHTLRREPGPLFNREKSTEKLAE